MSEKQNILSGMKGFFSEVGAEMHKITWPDRQELVGSTIVVIVSVVLFSLFIAVSDKILVEILKLLT